MVGWLWSSGAASCVLLFPTVCRPSSSCCLVVHFCTYCTLFYCVGRSVQCTVVELCFGWRHVCTDADSCTHSRPCAAHTTTDYAGTDKCLPHCASVDSDSHRCSYASDTHCSPNFSTTCCTIGADVSSISRADIFVDIFVTTKL